MAVEAEMKHNKTKKINVTADEIIMKDQPKIIKQ
jgi:hypothetical protein